MPTITVSAIDSATAMDQIIAQLGEDAMILDTKTKDGKLEIRATNDLAFQPKKIKAGERCLLHHHARRIEPAAIR